jgi:hypothetical protein
MIIIPSIPANPDNNTSFVSVKRAVAITPIPESSNKSGYALYFKYLRNSSRKTMLKRIDMIPTIIRSADKEEINVRISFCVNIQKFTALRQFQGGKDVITPRISRFKWPTKPLSKYLFLSAIS